MKFIRLPAQPVGEPQHWYASGNKENVFLIPGDALLTERVARPAAVKSRLQMRQWLEANPELCQWEPQKERLLYLVAQGDHLCYWAVAHDLWQYWQQWLSVERGVKYLLPDWMLLPAPAAGKFFALQADDTILFRHDEWSGGALTKDQRALVEGVNSRWLSLPGRGGEYVVSGVFLSHQARLGSRWRPRMPGSFYSKVLSILLLVCSAFLAEQGAEFIWLNETRSQEKTAQRQVLVPTEEAQGVLQTMTWLQQIQQQGPVQLQSLTLLNDGVTFRLLTPLSCNEMQRRLKSLALRSSFAPLEAGCGLVVYGDIP